MVPEDPVMFGPNITGNTGDRGGLTVDARDNGCFYIQDASRNFNDGEWSQVTLYLDASRSSSVFGGASTVQPASLRFLPCIKT